MSGTGPQGALDGLRVIEMGQLIAGPFCGQLLGDILAIEAGGFHRQQVAVIENHLVELQIAGYAVDRGKIDFRIGVGSKQ